MSEELCHSDPSDRMPRGRLRYSRSIRPLLQGVEESGSLTSVKQEMWCGAVRLNSQPRWSSKINTT